MSETQSVIVEREFPHAPAKIWRALTEARLLEQWLLMKTDFTPEIDHAFQLSGDWGAVDCRVLALETEKSLQYSWNAFGLESIVTWTLTPTGSGTHLRMEQAGFKQDQQQFYQGAKASWPQFFTNLDELLANA